MPHALPISPSLICLFGDEKKYYNFSSLGNKWGFIMFINWSHLMDLHPSSEMKSSENLRDKEVKVSLSMPRTHVRGAEV
jgi:hypothetical protein